MIFFITTFVIMCLAISYPDSVNEAFSCNEFNLANILTISNSILALWAFYNISLVRSRDQLNQYQIQVFTVTYILYVLMICGIVDHFDGPIARETKCTTKIGDLLDHTVDDDILLFSYLFLLFELLPQYRTLWLFVALRNLMSEFSLLNHPASVFPLFLNL